MPEYLTIKQIQEIVSFHRNTIIKWIKSGRLPYVKKGKYLVKKTDLDKFLGDGKWSES